MITVQCNKCMKPPIALYRILPYVPGLHDLHVCLWAQVVSAFLSLNRPTAEVCFLLPVQASSTPAGSPRAGGSRPSTARAGTRTSASSGRPGTAAAAGGRPRAAGSSAGGTSSAGGSGGSGSAAADGVEDEGSITSALLSKGDVEQRFEEILGAELLAGLKDAQWKVSWPRLRRR